jgi:hypothetical protein
LKAARVEDAAATTSPGGRKEPPQRCVNAWHLEEVLENLRKQGSNVQSPPGHWRTMLECGKKPAEEAPTKTDDERGKYVEKYDAFAGRRYAHYWARVATESGCAKNLTEVGTYTANEE